jgi:hypothetical protein
MPPAIVSPSCSPSPPPANTNHETQRLFDNEVGDSEDDRQSLPQLPPPDQVTPEPPATPSARQGEKRKSSGITGSATTRHQSVDLRNSPGSDLHGVERAAQAGPQKKRKFELATKTAKRTGFNGYFKFKAPALQLGNYQKNEIQAAQV